MPAFGALHSQPMTVQQSVNRPDQLAIVLQTGQRAAAQRRQLGLNRHPNRTLQAVERQFQLLQYRPGFPGGGRGGVVRFGLIHVRA